MLRARVKTLTEDRFIRHNFVFFFGYMTVAVFNYLYHPILSRLMSVEEFGEAQALVSIIVQAGVFAGIFGTIIVNIVSNHRDDAEKMKSVRTLYTIAFALNASIAALLIVLGPLIKNALELGSMLPLFLGAAIIVLNVPFLFHKSFLQGVHEFKAVSISGILGSAARLLGAVALVALGFAAAGAVGGLLLSALLSYAYVTSKTAGRFPLALLGARRLRLTGLRSELRYGGLILFATFLTTFFSNADVLVVKYFFDPEQAGLYSGISTIARIIFFATGSVSIILFPFIKMKNSPRENLAALLKGIGLIGAVGGSALVLFAIFPQLMIHLFIGGKYETASELLPRLGLVMFFVSFVNILVNYFLALRRYFLIFVSSGSIALLTALCFLRHETVSQIIDNFLIASGATCAALAGALITQIARHRHDYVRTTPV